MSSCTDYLRLNDHKLFKVIRETLPIGIRKTQNILTVKDDVLFVWNFQDTCVLALNLKAAKSTDVDVVRYQTLLPTSPPVFSPELLVANEHCELLAVAGPLGILVLQLPRRGPPHGSFGGGKEVIYCKNFSLDERLFAYNKLVEIRQIRWHPASKSENHLLVLTSDNMFRLYVINNDMASLVKVYQIGTQPTACLPGTRLPFLAGLGETGVDFDFGLPHTPNGTGDKSKTGHWDDLEWPIYILRGDGEVFIFIIDINEKKAPILKGPLAMYPSDDDNYGSDACAIMCFKTTPPILAVSTCTGTIYHGIVLTPDDETELGGRKNILKHSNFSIYPPDKVLYIFESIELELGISITDSDSSYSCPIFLHTDESNKGRYFCSHETGLHVVNAPIIKELNKFLETNDDNLDKCFPTLNKKSVAEYLLCTHATGTTQVNPVLGFSLFHCPTTSIILLGSGQVISLPLVSTMLLCSENQLDYDNDNNMHSPLKQMLKDPFDMHIKNCLKTELSQPILKLSKDANPSVMECYEILIRATHIFREEHFRKFENIRKEIEKRVVALQILKNHQINELQRIGIMKQDMQENAERLAEKYEDIKDKQEELTKRCEKLLILVTQKQPQPSESEKNLFKELKKAEEKIKSYIKAIDGVKSKHKYQEIQMKNWVKHEKKKEVILGSNQSTVIKNNLHDMTKQITEMIQYIKIQKQELGLN